jgi:hypothetical protein
MVFFFVLFMTLLISDPYLPAQQDCGECPHPLIEMKAMTIDGDIPKHFKNFGVEMAAAYWSGWTWVLFKRLNPCCDSYYILDIEGDLSRHGKKTGKAKYIIRPWAVITTASEGEQALIRHGKGFHGGEENDGWTTLEPVLVPCLGTIQINHELICLKNNQVYDEIVDVIDWIPDPPENEDYFAANESAVIDGETYIPGDGLIYGKDWGPACIADGYLKFDKGDVGITIRKKETPSSCSVDVDDIFRFPPHYILRITDIKNQFNETMPNNVKIALKTELGHIINGEELDGWWVFNSTDGQISEEILYHPPACEEAKVDTLTVAGICDYHDGPPSVGKPQFDRKVTNSRCYEAVVTMTSIHTKKKKYDRSSDPSYIDYKEHNTYDREIKTTITLGMELQRGMEMKVWNEYWEYYIEKSRDINSFSDKTRDYRYRYCQGKFSSWYNEMTGTEEGKEEKFGESLPIQVILVYDLPKKEPQRVIIGDLFLNYKIYKAEEHLSWVDGLLETEEKSDVDVNQSIWISPVDEDSNASSSPSLKYRDFVIESGDGKDSFRGEGKVEQIQRGDDCYNYDECRETKIFRWHFRRFKKDK